jgi:hypothetical protein
MEQVAHDFIKASGFRIGKDTSIEDVCDVVSTHMDSLVFNIAALASIITSLHKSPKLDMIHIPIMEQYIVEKCTGKRTMHGGRVVMPSDFYGYDHPAYSSANAGQDVLNVDIDNGYIARPALGVLSGGSAHARPVSHYKVVKDLVKSVLAKNKLKYSKAAMQEVLKMIDMHMRCFKQELQKHEPLTLKKIDAIVKKKRYFVFQ